MRKKYLMIGVAVVILVVVLLLLFMPRSSKTFTIKFDTAGGSNIENVKVKSGDTISKPNDPIKEGYIFIGWMLDGELFDFSTPIKENIKLVAKYEEIQGKVETFIVEFDTNGGSTIANQIVEKEGNVIKPEEPEKEGYEFKGWYVDNKEYDFSEKVTKNLTLSAKWEKKEEQKSAAITDTNKSKTNTNSSNSNKNNSNTASQSSNNTNKTNTTNDNNTNQNNNNTNTETKKTNTVTFNSNGGSNVASQTVIEGNKATQPSNPTREGYTFTGWTLNGNPYNFNSSVTSNITLLATWTQKTYTIGISTIDAYSPDRILTVYENGTAISVSAIKYIDGYTLCSGSNTTVNKNDIEGENSFIVVLSGGTQVTAIVN